MANVALFFDETGFGGTAGSDEAWAHVVAWEDSLPEDQYPTIHQLVANGWEDDLPGLEEDIRSAMEAEPPDPEVETTLNEFLSTLEDRGEDDTALAISLSEEPEEVVLDLPPVDGSVHTVDMDHSESWEGVPILHETGFADNARKKLPSQQLDITPEKACKILKDGEVRGHPLTERQRGLFGVICGRRGKQAAHNELDSVTRNEGSEKLPSSAYAYVPHAHRPGTWKLRIDGPKHVSASIAALSKANISKGELLGVKKRLRAAWRKFFPDKAVEDMPEVIRNVEYDQDEVDYDLAIDELTQMVEDGELPGEVFNMTPGAPGPLSEPAYSVGSGPQTASGAAIKARDASRKAHEASLRTSAAPLESRMALDAADRAVGHAQSRNPESAREEHRGASAAHLSASAHHKLLSSPGPAPAPDSGLVAHDETQMLPSISGVLATPLPTLEGDGTATRSAQSDLGTIIDMTGLASAHSNASALHEQAADLHADAYDELEPAPTSGITLPEDDDVTLSEDGSITLSQDETPGTLLSMWPNRARIATASSRRAHMATASIEGVSKGSMKESAEAVSDADEAENASRDENLRGRSSHKTAMKAHENLARYHKQQADKASKAGNKGMAVSHTTASQLHEEAATAHDGAYDEAGKPLSNEVYDPDLGLLKTD